jgi:hypothetical protein
MKMLKCKAKFAPATQSALVGLQLGPQVQEQEKKVISSLEERKFNFLLSFGFVSILRQLVSAFPHRLKWHYFFKNHPHTCTQK